MWRSPAFAAMTIGAAHRRSVRGPTRKTVTVDIISSCFVLALTVTTMESNQPNWRS